MDAAEASRTLVVLVDGESELMVGRLEATRPDLAVVDALARLQLAARRLGWSIRLRHPGPDLCALLELVGLADVVAGGACPGGSALQTGREAEGGEDLGVEEVVEPGDPPA